MPILRVCRGQEGIISFFISWGGVVVGRMLQWWLKGLMTPGWRHMFQPTCIALKSLLSSLHEYVCKT
jgi:hypothetical protein